MDLTRIHNIIKFAIADAGMEDPGSRELGPIHLIKIAYLADLAYASRHGGETYTGVTWRFYHYGPWAFEVFKEIDKAAEDIGAQKRVISSPKFENDSARYYLHDEEAYEQLIRALPGEIASEIQMAVHTFGADTSSLLHYVYKTPPMLCAAPGEVLSFKKISAEMKIISARGPREQKELSAREQKKRKEALNKLREEVRRKLKERAETEVAEISPPPRYDEVFFNGQKWLDNLAGDELESSSGEISVSDEIWKSQARCEPDVP